MNTVVDKELSIRGVFRYANTYEAGVRLVASRQYPLESIVTDRFGLEDTLAAFETAMHQRERSIKVMVTP
jgi:L-iditol 2-dehydrogenase